MTVQNIPSLASARKSMTNILQKYLQLYKHIRWHPSPEGLSRDQYRANKTPKNRQKKSSLATQNGHILRFLTSLNDSITFSEKKLSHYVLPTNPTRSRSEKPYPTPPRSANALETNAPSLTPNYAYEEMKCTSSRACSRWNHWTMYWWHDTLHPRSHKRTYQ